MAETPSVEQEPRTSHAALRLSRSEKRALVLVAHHRLKSESDLLREMTIDQIVAEYARLFPTTDVESA